MTTSRPIAFALIFLMSAALTPAGEVTVHLGSGRSFTGKVDERTSDEVLWLRAEGTASSVVRPIQWSAIEQVHVDGRGLTPDEFRTASAELKTAFEPVIADAGVHPTLGGVSAADQAGALLGFEVPGARAARSGEVRSLDFDARLANLDADPLTDGFWIWLAPLDAQGLPTMVTGTLTVEVYGFDRVGFDQRPHGRGDRLKRFGRHVVQLDASHFHADGTAMVPIPLARHIPNDASAIGLIHVELAVAGQGVFEASRDGVRLRPFAPTRDYLQLKGRPRVLPTER